MSREHTTTVTCDRCAFTVVQEERQGCPDGWANVQFWPEPEGSGGELDLDICPPCGETLLRFLGEKPLAARAPDGAS